MFNSTSKFTLSFLPFPGFFLLLLLLIPFGPIEKLIYEFIYFISVTGYGYFSLRLFLSFLLRQNKMKTNTLNHFHLLRWNCEISKMFLFFSFLQNIFKEIISQSVYILKYYFSLDLYLYSSLVRNKIDIKVIII